MYVRTFDCPLYFSLLLTHTAYDCDRTLFDGMCKPRRGLFRVLMLAPCMSKDSAYRPFRYRPQSGRNDEGPSQGAFGGIASTLS